MHVTCSSCSRCLVLNFLEHCFRAMSNFISISMSLFVYHRSQLISSHEDQLATVTSLCKQEMKLLLGAKAGNKVIGGKSNLKIRSTKKSNFVLFKPH